jgi:hypothetical protein
MRRREHHRISELELASRLSFSLERIPDDELLELASKAERSHSSRKQVRRMLADPGPVAGDQLWWTVAILARTQNANSAARVR